MQIRSACRSAKIWASLSGDLSTGTRENLTPHQPRLLYTSAFRCRRSPSTQGAATSAALELARTYPGRSPSLICLSRLLYPGRPLAGPRQNEKRQEDHRFPGRAPPERSFRVIDAFRAPTARQVCRLACAASIIAARRPWNGIGAQT